MTVVELEARITRIRTQPLRLLCKTKSGKVREMTVAECVRTGSAFLHIICDDLDKLLEGELPHIETTK